MEEKTLTTIALKPSQLQLIRSATPQQFVKTKPGRGGKRVAYVEVGYIINQLNKVFGPLNWSFKVTDHGRTERKNESRAEGEVWVYGELTIHDHKNGYSMTKGQFGQHPIHEKVPIGDALKAAESDSLKKCASLIGISLDLMWRGMDAEEIETKPTKPVEVDMFKAGVDYIKSCSDVQILRQLLARVDENAEFTVAQKFQIKKLINAKLKNPA